MAIYTVKNHWGKKTAPWHDGGLWVLGCRENQKVMAIHIQSEDNGKTFSGYMVYEGEGQIGVRATQIAGNNYTVENQWGGEDAEWHPGGNWVIGARSDQNVIALEIEASAEENNLKGTMTYEGEGPIGFEGSVIAGSSYSFANQWGGDQEPWHQGGTMVLGTRAAQNPISFDINSADNGQSFTGYMTYEGEGHIGFKATLIAANNYAVENQWGGDDAPWHEGGAMLIGGRKDQNCVQLKLVSDDDGKTLNGEMTYDGEGPIGAKLVLSSCDNNI